MIASRFLNIITTENSPLKNPSGLDHAISCYLSDPDRSQQLTYEPSSQIRRTSCGLGLAPSIGFNIVIYSLLPLHSQTIIDRRERVRPGSVLGRQETTARIVVGRCVVDINCKATI